MDADLVEFLSQFHLLGYASRIVEQHRFTSLNQLREFITTDDDVRALGIEPLAHRKLFLAALRKKGHKAAIPPTHSFCLSSFQPTTNPSLNPAVHPSPTVSSAVLTPHLDEAALAARQVPCTIQQLQPSRQGCVVDVKEQLTTLTTTLKKVVEQSFIPALVHDIEAVVARYDEIISCAIRAHEQNRRAVVGQCSDVLGPDAQCQLLAEVDPFPASKVQVDVSISGFHNSERLVTVNESEGRSSQSSTLSSRFSESDYEAARPYTSPPGRTTLPPQQLQASPQRPSNQDHKVHQDHIGPARIHQCPTRHAIDGYSREKLAAACEQFGVALLRGEEEEDWFEEMVVACREDNGLSASQGMFLERSKSPQRVDCSLSNRLALKQVALRHEFASSALPNLLSSLPTWGGRFPSENEQSLPSNPTQSQADLLPRAERELAKKRLRSDDEQEANQRTIIAFASQSVTSLERGVGHVTCFERATMREATSTSDMLAAVKQQFPHATLNRVTSILTSSGVPVISQKDTQAKAAYYASHWRRRRFGK